MTHWLFLIAIVLAIDAPGASPIDAGPVVLASGGPRAPVDYPAGTRLPDSARLTLRTLDWVIVVRGRYARVFHGPGNFAAGDFASPDRFRVPMRRRYGAPAGIGFEQPAPDLLKGLIACPADSHCPR